MRFTLDDAVIIPRDQAERVIEEAEAQGRPIHLDPSAKGYMAVKRDGDSNPLVAKGRDLDPDGDTFQIFQWLPRIAECDGDRSVTQVSPASLRRLLDTDLGARAFAFHAEATGRVDGYLLI